MAELAFVEGVSENTLSAEIRRDPEFPVLERGSNGVAYRFDLDEVREHRRAQKAVAQAEAQKAAAARRAQLNLWIAENYGEEIEHAPDITPAERKILGEAIKIEDYNRLHRGQLLEREPLAAALRQIFGQLQTDMRQLAPDFARQVDLTRAQRIALDGLVRQRVNRAVERLQDLAGSQGRSDEEMPQKATPQLRVVPKETDDG